MNCQPAVTLAEVRSNIDSLDQQIILLIAERQKWVVTAGSLKNNEDEVRAPARFEQVIEKARTLAHAAGASPEVVENTYRAMINSFIELELERHRVEHQKGNHMSTPFVGDSSTCKYRHASQYPAQE